LKIVAILHSHTRVIENQFYKLKLNLDDEILNYCKVKLPNMEMTAQFVCLKECEAIA